MKYRRVRDYLEGKSLEEIRKIKKDYYKPKLDRRVLKSQSKTVEPNEDLLQSTELQQE